MIISDLNNAYIKIHKNSISVFNKDTLKTCGVVKNVTRFLDLQANKQIQYSQKLRALNIWGNANHIIKNTFIIDGVIYQLRNLAPLAFYDAERIKKEDAFYNNLSENGVVVVNVEKIFN